jgi:hypothetical protein
MASKTGPAVAVPQTFEELQKANEGYLNWLDSIGAQEEKRRFLQSLQESAVPLAPTYPRYYAYHVPAFLCQTRLVQIGGVSLSPYTHRTMNFLSLADPLNLIFVGNAGVDRVAEIFIDMLFPPWLDTVIPNVYNCADIQWVYLRNAVRPRWQQMNYTLALGGCALNRCHVRLFDGGHDEQLGDFTLAGVHYEESHLRKIHVIQDWDKSQDFVRRLFESKPFCKGIREERLQDQGEERENVAHDGIASVIELQ